MSTEQAYRDYVAGNLDRLRRTAYLLCGDWHLADDLTSTVLVKLLRHWRRAAVMEHRDAYVRRMLMSAWLDERRRPWRRESSTDRLPDRPAAAADADQRLDVLSLLAGLPRAAGPCWSCGTSATCPSRRPRRRSAAARAP